MKNFPKTNVLKPNEPASTMEPAKQKHMQINYILKKRIARLYLNGTEIKGVYVDLSPSLETKISELPSRIVTLKKGTLERDAFLEKWRKQFLSRTTAARMGVTTILLMSLAACSGEGGTSEVIDIVEDSLSAGDTEVNILSAGDTEVNISSAFEGAVIKVASASSTTAYSQVIINATGAGDLVIDFADENDTVVLEASSKISGFESIVVKNGTLDLSKITLPDTVKVIYVGSRVVITHDQLFNDLDNGVTVREGATSGDVTIIVNGRVQALEVIQSLGTLIRGNVLLDIRSVGPMGELTISEFKLISGYLEGQMGSYSIKDTAANLLTSSVTDILQSADTVALLNKAVGALSVDDVKLLQSLGLSDFTYSLRDTDENLSDAENADIVENAVNILPNGTVAISGVLAQNEVLTAAVALSYTDGLGEFSYQWKANGANIIGGTDDSLTLTQELVGKNITLTVSYTDGNGTVETVSSQASAPVRNVNDVPAFSTNSGTTFSSAIENTVPTLSNTILARDDDGDDLVFSVVGGAEDGSGVSELAGVYGVLRIQQSTGSFNYTLTENFADVLAEGQEVFEPFMIKVDDGNSDQGSLPTISIRIRVEGTNDQPIVTFTTPNIAENISGQSARIDLGAISVADADTNDTLALSLQNTTISQDFEIDQGHLYYTGSGLNYESFVNGQLQLQLIVQNGPNGTIQYNQALKINVSNANDTPTGSVTISGAFARGQVITANASILDEDGLGSLSYQWKVDGVAIVGATSRTYTLTANEVGKKITSIVSYSDNLSNPESVESAASEAVTEPDITAPTIISFSVSPTQFTDPLAPGDTLTYTAQASEELALGTSMRITLSNEKPITLTVDEADPTTLVGTYVVQATDVDSADLTISQFTGQTATDLSGNALVSSSDLPAAELSAITGMGSNGIEIDTTPPTAAMAVTGHAYDVATQTLTLQGTNFGTLGATLNTDTKENFDFSKLFWDVNNSGNTLISFTSNDFVSVKVIDDTTLELVLSQTKASALSSTIGFGGETNDGIDFNSGFLIDTAGNTSEQAILTTATVTMQDTTAPTLTSISIVPSIASGLLGIGDSLVFTAIASETLVVGTTMRITLSNEKQVKLTVDQTDATKLVGTYTISATDNDSTDLTISQFTRQTAVDLSGNLIDLSEDVTPVESVNGDVTIVVDATAPSSEIALTGHTYTASTNTLTLSGSGFSTSGATTGVSNKGVFDFSKLFWDINNNSNVIGFDDLDILSAVVNSDTQITMTISQDKVDELTQTLGFGGASSAEQDGIDIDEGFLLDLAGNASEQLDITSALITMADQTAPTVQSFTVTPSVQSGPLGPGATITYTATASEHMTVGTSMRITLSNEAQIMLAVDANDPTKLEGTYTIATINSEDSDLTIVQFTPQTAVDTSGNALVGSASLTSTEFNAIVGVGTQGIVVDTITPTASAVYNQTSDLLTILFSEAVVQTNIESELQALTSVADSATASWNTSTNYKVEIIADETTLTTEEVSNGNLNIELTVIDLAGNQTDYTLIPIEIV